MNENNELGILHNPRVAQFAMALLAVATLLFAVQVVAEINNFNESPNAQQNVINVSGEGKVSAPPDIASVSFTVSEDATTASVAQDAAAKKTNAALAALKEQKIEDKDIQTSSYNVYPKYSQPQPCVYNAAVYSGVVIPPCAQGESKIIGYTASQTITVKIRNLDSVGTTVTALGKAGASNINGPSFTIDNPDAVQAEARTKAIKDARTQADALAKDLGVHIVRVVSYSEGGNRYYAPSMKAVAMDSASGSAVTTPSIPTGENDVVVDVSVTYEIR